MESTPRIMSYRIASQPASRYPLFIKPRFASFFSFPYRSDVDAGWRYCRFSRVNRSLSAHAFPQLHPCVRRFGQQHALTKPISRMRSRDYRIIPQIDSQYIDTRTNPSRNKPAIINWYTEKYEIDRMLKIFITIRVGNFLGWIRPPSEMAFFVVENVRIGSRWSVGHVDCRQHEISFAAVAVQCPVSSVRRVFYTRKSYIQLRKVCALGIERFEHAEPIKLNTATDQNIRVFASFCASARNHLFYTRITARPDRAIASYNYTRRYDCTRLRVCVYIHHMRVFRLIEFRIYCYSVTSRILFPYRPHVRILPSCFGNFPLRV